MSNLKTGQEVGTALCAAFGVDPKNVKSITLTCDPREMAAVTIVCWVPGVVLGSLVEKVTEYQLTEVAE